MSPQTHRVFVVEDNAAMRETMRMLLRVLDAVEFCGEASQGKEALEKLPEAAPDLVLVDLSLPDMDGLDLVRELRDDHPGIKTLVISGHNQERFAQPALDAGASGFVQKGMAHTLREAIETVLRGEIYLSGK